MACATVSSGPRRVKEAGRKSHLHAVAREAGVLWTGMWKDDVDAGCENARSMNFDQSPDRVRRPDWLAGVAPGRVPTVPARFGRGQGPI